MVEQGLEMGGGVQWHIYVVFAESFWEM